ncbi:MAG TPA: CpsB/CapC family capsule biosynthesis tyrosine phosphatase [Puia sp.]|nr:CpsB/CapC family capsule biosynthesis tyrosine phosphatase [Puia sp.]
MFSFFTSRSREGRSGGFAGLQCDLHSHLIPGIDDGSPDLDTSLRLIRGLAELGYKKLITTPHVNADIFPNTPDVILSGCRAVETALREQQIDVSLHAAAEYLLDDGFSRALADGTPLLTLKDNLVLVELSFAVPAINLKDMLFQLQLKGYQPILAHPERYLYFGANKGWYDTIRETGCLFQLNLLSFIGYYGRDAKRLADYLVKKRYFDFLGTDLHHQRHLDALRSSGRLPQLVDRLLGTGLIQNPRL